jgi:hypothetical protein
MRLAAMTVASAVRAYRTVGADTHHAGASSRHHGCVRRGIASIGVAGLFAAVACRQLVGIGDGPSGAGTDAGGGSDAGDAGGASDGPGNGEGEAGTCGGFPWATGACGTCIEASCCGEAAACRGDPACAPVLECMASCAGSDDGCRHACVTQAPDTTTLALIACQSRSCTSDCGLPCGGFFGVIPGAAGPCQSCLEENDCTVAATCAGSVACLETQFCGAACLPLDVTCVVNCEATHPLGSLFDGGPGFGPSNNACASTCGDGTTWTCAGHATWPLATAATISFELRVVDGTSGTPVAGAQVSVCPPLDDGCASPLSTGTTDANGMVPLTSTMVPFLGYLQISAAGHWTDLSYTYPYLAESTAPGVTFVDAIYSDDAIAGIASQLHLPLDPSFGIIAATAFDCTASLAAGVTFGGSGLGDAAAPYYFVGATPTTAATATSLPSAAGGFYDVAPGLVTFTASENGTQVATVAVLVRAQSLTQLELVPTPP